MNYLDFVYPVDYVNCNGWARWSFFPTRQGISKKSTIQHLIEKIMSKKTTGNPFFLFAIFSFLSALLLCAIIHKQFHGYSLNNIYPRFSKTLSISLFGTFVPLVFAAIIYCKTKLSQTAPEIFSELSIDNKIVLAMAMLTVIFLTSLITPLMEMENTWYVLLQLSLILCSFVLSGSFVLGMFEVAKYSKMLQIFGTTARKKLKGQILKYNNLEKEKSKNKVAHIIENFINMTKVNIKSGSRKDLEITLKELQLYTSSFFDLISNTIAILKSSRFNYSKQNKYTDLRVSSQLEEIHKSISDLLFVELSKLIHGISNVKEEKYLESFIPLLKEVISKTLSLDTGYHSRQWSGFIKETTFRTAVLKHTTYPNAAIDLYEILIIWEFRYSLSNPVYGLSSDFKDLVKIIGVLKSKEKSFKMWYSGLQAKVINIMLSLLPMCTKYHCDRLVIQEWAGYIQDIIQEVDSEDSNSLLDGRPILNIIQALSQNSLPFMYQQAADNILSTDYDNQIKLRQLHTLTPVYSIYRALIDKDIEVRRELTQSLAIHFYKDLQICNDIHEEILDCWIESLSEEYKSIFNEMYQNYIQKEHKTGYFDLEHSLSIPAIALVTNEENQTKLGNEIVNRFADMLISVFNNNEQKDANGWERANILLLSAWLKKTDRLQEKLTILESILKEYPYSNFNINMTDYQSCGYPSSTFTRWDLPQTIVWPNDICQKVNSELMDLDFLIKYGKKFVVKTRPGQ